MRIASLLALVALLSGCGLIYKIDVQQGNYVTEEAVARVKEGMSKSDVRQALGTPLLTDIFHGNRWDYYFSNEKRGRKGERSRVTIVFKDDKVVSVTGHAPAPLEPTGPSDTPPPRRGPPT